MISAFIDAYTEIAETMRRIERSEERKRFVAKKSRSRKQKHKGNKKR